MPSKLSVIIPCYNQTILLKGLLESLKEQTFHDFELIIIDDNSSENYTELLKSFNNFFKITYIRNEKNLGAIGNMFYAIKYPVNSEYVICIHEDDFLYKTYLESAVKILDDNQNIVFVGSTSITFTDENDYENKVNIFENNSIKNDFLKFKSNDFVRYLLSGKHFTFGSVVYRSKELFNKYNDLNRFSVTCDRPFLLSVMDNKFSCAILKNPHIFYRDHGYHDNRGNGIKWQHLFNLYEFYKEYLNLNEKKDKKLFFNNSTNNLIYSYHNLRSKEINFFRFIFIGIKKDLINFYYFNKIGIFAVLSLILGRKRSFKLKLFLNKFYELKY